MTINDKIKDEKLQYDINKKAAKILALSLGKIDKYEHHTGKNILPSDQSRIIEQAKFIYSPLAKALEKQINTIEDPGEKQIKAIENRVEKHPLDTDQKSITALFSKDILTEEAIYELNKIKETKQKTSRDDLIYKTGEKRNIDFRERK